MMTDGHKVKPETFFLWEHDGCSVYYDSNNRSLRMNPGFLDEEMYEEVETDVTGFVHGVLCVGRGGGGCAVCT